MPKKYLDQRHIVSVLSSHPSSEIMESPFQELRQNFIIHFLYFLQTEN